VFVSGVVTSPPPVRIYSLLRVGVSPEINAVGTTMIGITLFLALATLPLLLWRRHTEPPAAGAPAAE
jgi:ABC-type spermidine/putrescine transport system permease subunit II